MAKQRIEGPLTTDQEAEYKKDLMDNQAYLRSFAKREITAAAERRDETRSNVLRREAKTNDDPAEAPAPAPSDTEKSL